MFICIDVLTVMSLVRWIDRYCTTDLPLVLLLSMLTVSELGVSLSTEAIRDGYVVSAERMTVMI